MTQSNAITLKLKVAEALSKDMGRAFARMDPEDIEKLQLAIGDIVEVKGKRKTVCKAMPAYKELRGQSRVQLDGLTRENAGAGLDEHVSICKIVHRPAEQVMLTPINIIPLDRDLKYIGSLLNGLLFSLYFLGPRNLINSFRRVFQGLPAKEGRKILLSGPWPPINFVLSPQGGPCHD